MATQRFGFHLMRSGNFLLTRIYQLLNVIGFTLLLIGGTGLVLGFLGLIDLQIFAFGLSAGVRVLGTIAITGCLLGAIGSFGQEINKT